MNISVDELLSIEELDTRAIFEGVKYPYPLSSVRGYIPEKSILKNNGEIVERK